MGHHRWDGCRRSAKHGSLSICAGLANRSRCCFMRLAGIALAFVVVAMFASQNVTALVDGVASKRTGVLHQSSTQRPQVRFSGHWMFGLQGSGRDVDEMNVRNSFDNLQRGVQPLRLHVHIPYPLHVVARSPEFSRQLRTSGIPDSLVGSVYIDRPPVGGLLKVDTNCLRTREPALRTLNLTQWSVEAVVLFLESPHFGRAWQTVPFASLNLSSH